jgi:hypothetical protein
MKHVPTTKHGLSNQPVAGGAVCCLAALARPTRFDRRSLRGFSTPDGTGFDEAGARFF